MSASFDDGQWSKWCAESLLLLLQHLQRMKTNERVCRQVFQKVNEIQANRLTKLVDLTPAVILVKQEPGEEQHSEAGSVGQSSVRTGVLCDIKIEHTLFRILWVAYIGVHSEPIYPVGPDKPNRSGGPTARSIWFTRAPTRSRGLFQGLPLLVSSNLNVAFHRGNYAHRPAGLRELQRRPVFEGSSDGRGSVVAANGLAGSARGSSDGLRRRRR